MEYSGLKMSYKAIVEETLTSDEYVFLFVISILNMYIWNFNIYVPIGIIFKEKHAKVTTQLSRDYYHPSIMLHIWIKHSPMCSFNFFFYESELAGDIYALICRLILEIYKLIGNYKLIGLTELCAISACKYLFCIMKTIMTKYDWSASSGKSINIFLNIFNTLNW